MKPVKKYAYEFRNEELKLKISLQSKETLKEFHADFLKAIEGKAPTISYSSFRRLVNELAFCKGWVCSLVNVAESNKTNQARKVANRSEKRQTKKSKKKSADKPHEFKVATQQSNHTLKRSLVSLVVKGVIDGF